MPFVIDTLYAALLSGNTLRVEDYLFVLLKMSNVSYVNVFALILTVQKTGVERKCYKEEYFHQFFSFYFQ